jgi:hypothetical protein
LLSVSQSRSLGGAVVANAWPCRAQFRTPPHQKDNKMTLHQESWTLDSLARLLAGMPALMDSGYFSSIRQLPVWKAHSEDLDDLFEQFEALYATPFSQWAHSNLSTGSHTDTVFYPFSGPDFIFAHLLFPRASNYILCGLEKCAPTDWATRFDEALLPDTLLGTASCISHFLKHSYFLTSDLREHVREERVPGILPILLVMLVRAGCRVESVHPIRPQSEAADACDGPEHGLQIGFRKGRTKGNVFYFPQDLRDDFFSRESALFRFISSLDDCAVFSKSASYLLHESNFSTVRSLIFERCSMLVQDPSSMPYRLLEESGWDMNLYGCYSGTIPVFDRYEQLDLIQAYQAASESKPLGFGIGYATDPHSASLIAAKRAKNISCEEI